MNFSFGDVLLLHFPYTDFSATKPRPIIVLLDTGDEDFLVARVTSQEPHSRFDVALKDWEEIGLKLPSIVRLHKLVTLHNRDQENLKATLKEMWDL
jgi:mRNA interferase MazF